MQKNIYSSKGKKEKYLYFTYKMDTLDTIDQTQETIQMHTIAPRQKNFLDYYFDTKSPTRSNGTLSYIRAYNPDIREKKEKNAGYNIKEAHLTQYNAASFSTYNILRSEKLQGYIQMLLYHSWYNDISVDMKHNQLIHTASSESVSLEAIKHYDKKKWRLQAENSTNVTIDLKDIWNSIQEAKDVIVIDS